MNSRFGKATRCRLHALLSNVLPQSAYSANFLTTP